MKSLKQLRVSCTGVTNAALEDLWNYLSEPVIATGEQGVPAKKAERLGRPAEW